ncbi:hypothetical protein IWX84_001851 [Flavobacterium sp. CG_9.10]|jgi:hypothetical protein|nr:hypothetical protein [Flavobacterium sp. CG_9.10]
MEQLLQIKQIENLTFVSCKRTKIKKWTYL